MCGWTWQMFQNTRGKNTLKLLRRRRTFPSMSRRVSPNKNFNIVILPHCKMHCSLSYIVLLFGCNLKKEHSTICWNLSLYSVSQFSRKLLLYISFCWLTISSALIANAHRNWTSEKRYLVHNSFRLISLIIYKSSPKTWQNIFYIIIMKSLLFDIKTSRIYDTNTIRPRRINMQIL